MDTASISLEELRQRGTGLKVKESKVLFLPDDDTLAVIVKEDLNTVKWFKALEVKMSTTHYFEQQDTLAVAVGTEPLAENSVKFYIPLKEERIFNALQKIVTSYKRLELYVFSEQFEEISVIPLFDNEVSKAVLGRTIDAIKNKKTQN